MNMSSDLENEYEILFRFTDDMLLAISDLAEDEKFMNFYQEWGMKFISLPIRNLGAKPETKDYQHKYMDEYLKNLKDDYFK